MPAQHSRISLIVLDAVVIVVAYLVAMFIRFAEVSLSDALPTFLRDLAIALPVIVAIHLAMNALTGLYRFSPSGSDRPALMRRVFGVVFAVMVVFVLIGVARPFVLVPLSVVLLAGAELLCLIGLTSISLSKVSTGN